MRIKVSWPLLLIEYYHRYLKTKLNIETFYQMVGAYVVIDKDEKSNAFTKCNE